MAEKHLVIDGMELRYEGIFDMNGLLRAIDKYTAERGYAKSEKRRQEIVKKTGKEFSMELRPTKAKTAYLSLMIKMRISITNLKNVNVVRNKRKRKLNKGNITILFDAWTTSDFEMRWSQKPIYYFFMILVDKFWKKIHSNKFEDELVEDTNYVFKNIKAHLDLFHY